MKKPTFFRNVPVYKKGLNRLSRRSDFGYTREYGRLMNVMGECLKVGGSVDFHHRIEGEVSYADATLTWPVDYVPQEVV